MAETHSRQVCNLQAVIQKKCRTVAAGGSSRPKEKRQDGRKSSTQQDGEAAGAQQNVFQNRNSTVQK